MKKTVQVNYDVLCYILQYCDRVENIMKQFGYEEEIFQRNFTYRDAISMNLLQIGELAGRLSDDYRLQTKMSMNWSAIRGMRNLLAHDYGHMNEHIIWHTAVSSVQELKDFCLSETVRLESLLQEELDGVEEDLELRQQWQIKM